jgi:hypothetical protein
MLGDRE